MQYQTQPSEHEKAFLETAKAFFTQFYKDHPQVLEQDLETLLVPRANISPEFKKMTEAFPEIKPDNLLWFVFETMRHCHSNPNRDIFINDLRMGKALYEGLKNCRACGCCSECRG